MRALQALPRLRAHAQSRMTSRATVRRLTDRTAQNETTGLEVAVWDTIHTDLPCRLPSTGTRGLSQTLTIAGVEYETANGIWDCPHDVTDLADGDLVEITAGEWAGRVLRIVEAVQGDQMTARRLPVEHVDRPTEWA